MTNPGNLARALRQALYPNSPLDTAEAQATLLLYEAEQRPEFQQAVAKKDFLGIAREVWRANSASSK